MHVGAAHHRDDDEEFVLSIFVAPQTDASATPKRTRLLQVVRNHRTGTVDLHLPERTDIVSMGWVPEIAYDATEHGYTLSAVIRPDLTPFLAAEKARHQDDDAPTRESGTSLEPGGAHGYQESAGAAKETARSAGTDTLYEVTFRNREIRVNGFRLSRPNFNSENEVVFDYLFRNPNRRIDLAEIESVTGRPLAKKLREVVRDLGFRNDLRGLFFPGISKTTIEFVNPVTRADFDARGLRPPQLDIR